MKQDVFLANTHQEILPDSRNLSDPIDLAVYTSGLRLADAQLGRPSGLPGSPRYDPGVEFPTEATVKEGLFYTFGEAAAPFCLEGT